jgi:hypothetical protein
MQKIVVKASDSNTKIEKYILSIYPNLSYSTLQKTFRKRDIKVNGKRVDRDYIVKAGDVLEIFIKDELLDGSANRSIIQGIFTVSGNSMTALLLVGREATPNRFNISRNSRQPICGLESGS